MTQDTVFFAATDLGQVSGGKTLQDAFDTLIEDSGDSITLKDVTFYEAKVIKIELVTKPTITKVISSKEK